MLSTIHDLVPSEVAAAPFIPDLYQFGIDRAQPGGLYMEFGVADGNSLEEIRRLLPLGVKLYGFDSFNGLPEEWNGFPVGSFATPVRVNLRNTELIIGEFSETIPRFLNEHSGYISFMHIDCDLYSSTRVILKSFADRIVNGTVAVFDELFGYSTYEQHEYRALKDSGLEFKIIGRWDCYRAAVQFTGKKI